MPWPHPAPSHLVGARFTRVLFRSFAARNHTAAGVDLGVADARATFEDATFSSSLTWR